MSISQYDTLNYASYTPMSTQETWGPLEYMRNQHDKLQEELANQEQQGSLSLLGLNPQVDSDAIKIQQDYIKKTQDVAN